MFFNNCLYQIKSSFTLFFYLRIKSSLSDSNFIIFYSPIEIIVCEFYFDFNIYDIDFVFFGAIFPIYFQNNIENKKHIKLFMITYNVKTSLSGVMKLVYRLGTKYKF
jgi:hypothetical protein